MSVIYAEDRFQQIESKHDDCPPRGQWADGYGSKIWMPYLVRLDGKGPWRRVYCTQMSNVGSVWILVKNVRYYFREDENLKLTGVWPKRPQKGRPA